MPPYSGICVFVYRSDLCLSVSVYLFVCLSVGTDHHEIVQQEMNKKPSCR